MTTAVRGNHRELILDVALKQMSEHGSTGASMRALARECGLNVATLYHYFESKDELLAAVVAERQYGTRLAAVPAIDHEAPAIERLRTIWTTVWDGAMEEQAVWRLLLGEGIRGESSVRPVAQELFAVMRDGLPIWIASALPEITDAAGCTELMIGQLFSGFVELIFDPDLDVAKVGKRNGDLLERTLNLS